MTTFRTYLKIFLSHRVYIAIYLVMLSLVGVIIGLSAYSGTTGEFQVAPANVAVIDRDGCLLYTSPSPRDYAASRMPSSA